MSDSSDLLKTIKSPDDIRMLSPENLVTLAQEIRTEIIRVVTTNGGHLASSLGAVELIIALHFVFDTPQDQIIFDVGHQTYAHKILTGRGQKFSTLRQSGGLSGFPKREESPYDAFNTGHASTSISAALGLATARDLNAKNNSVIAVIGDGALTGGMAMEAMNHAGGLNKNLLVVFNDNRMSISPNVGALSQYLSLKLTSPEHIQLREKVKDTLNKIMPKKGGRLIRRFQNAEESLKNFLLSPNSFLAAWGFKYLGPIDGHDLTKLIEALRHVRNLKRPVLLHVLTTKGKGYAPAENNPLAFHGLGQAKQVSDKTITEPATRSYTDIFGNYLVKKAETDPQLVAITAAMSQGTGLTEFFKLYPDRAFDVGIAEQHSITFAAGLAVAGFRPVVAIYSTFLQRAFDQLYHDIALQNLPVILAIDRAGLVGEDGSTHHGALDLSYLRLLPNFTVMAPKDEHELIEMLDWAMTLHGPVALRYPRGAVTGQPPQPNSQPLSTGQAQVLLNGSQATILALGQMVWPACEAAEILKKENLSVGVINLRFLKPLDKEIIFKASETGPLITVEENSLTGGLFGAVAEAIAGCNKVRLKGIGLPDEPIAHASQKQQRAQLGLDAQGLASSISEFLHN